MIKKTIECRIEEAEENITKLIDENFQITIAELNKSKHDIKELKNEINGSKTSLQFTESELK